MIADCHKRLLAWALAHCNGRYERFIAERKRALFADLHGVVLEIGAGTCPNLALYPKGIRWIGVEPNRHMHPYALLEARRLGMTIELMESDIERVELAEGTVEAVVATLVLCSIDDPGRVLRKIVRLLKPGGKFVFIEHVAAPAGTWARSLQAWVRPAWEIIFDGCRPDRDTKAMIAAAGFAEVQCEFFRAPLPLVGLQVAGWATTAQA